ncbi:hypothetical protein PInf_019288 [Phytophthora infestans]|nr:hypothetical protein PInf_019288 [Phytophthora infestans]
MEESGNVDYMPAGTAPPNPFDLFVEAIERIAVGLSQQDAQMHQDFQAQLHAYQEQLQQVVPLLNPLGRVSMPIFSGKPDELVDKFIFRAKLFMEGKGIDYVAAANQQRVIAILAANLRGGAASWYPARVVIAMSRSPRWTHSRMLYVSVV